MVGGIGRLQPVLHQVAGLMGGPLDEAGDAADEDMFLERLGGLLQRRDVLVPQCCDAAFHLPQLLLRFKSDAARLGALAVAHVVLVMHDKHLRQGDHHHHQEDCKHQQLFSGAAARGRCPASLPHSRRGTGGAGSDGGAAATGSGGGGEAP